jgi:predicted TIM-barrel fold metal-dependent hydrolase
MEIVDAHIHALPRGDMHGGQVDARLETVLQRLREKGIRRAVLLPINDLSYQPVEEMNDFSERAVLECRDLVGFVDVDLSQAHYYRGIQRLENDVARRCQNGLQGIKIHLQNLGVQASDWRLLPLYRLAGELNVPVAIHCHPGSCPGTVDNSHPAEIEKVVRAFHKSHFVIAHLGGVLYFEYMPWLCHENVHFDCSGVMADLWRYYGVDRVRYVLEQIGYDRLFFGSDFPAVDIEQQLEATKALIPAAQQAAVFGQNVPKFGEQFGWWKQSD